jgi:outer membrane protein assembly factor BamB
MSRGPIHLPIHDQSLRDALRQSAQHTAIVAGAFAGVVAVVMLVILLSERPRNLALQIPTDDLKKQLVAGPTDAIRNDIRGQDLRLRESYFHRRAMLVHGAWLLIGGAVVLLVCLKLTWELSAEAYLPVGSMPNERLQQPRVRLGVGIAGATLAAILLLLFFPSRRDRSIERAGVPAVIPPAVVPPVVATAQVALPPDAWPAFRGAGGIGVGAGEYPTQWEAGRGILWKTPVPLPGNSSPIVCGGKVFVTGGSNQRREVYCFDAITGSLQWTALIGPQGGPEPKLAADTGWAPSTMSTDGQRVFAIFPTGYVGCLDLSGKTVWEKNLGLPDNLYGHASSLMCSDGMLYVQMDQGADAKAPIKSQLFAFDCTTGQQVWKVSRPVISSWSTPIAIPGPAGKQIVALGDPWIVAYDARNGVEIWRAKGLSGEIAPSPAFAGGFVYAATEASRLFQVRIDGHGDVTASHVKKIDSDSLPDIVSPLAVKDRVLLIQTNGAAAWVDPTSAKQVWTHDFEGGVHASPVLAGNVIYVISSDGIVHTFEASDTFKELGTSPVGEPVSATPAFSAGRIYIRGEKDLLCIGTK